MVLIVAMLLWPNIANAAAGELPKYGDSG
jgi:hypothetical protein